jgi:hypothetical protein
MTAAPAWVGARMDAVVVGLMSGLQVGRHIV